MPLNKLQMKAKVFEVIEPARNLGAFDSIIVSSLLSELRAIKDADFEFISKLLIKEANEKKVKPATAFLYMAERLAPENFMDFILSELNSKNVSDSKKMFLMNIMAGVGVSFNRSEIDLYLKNPIDAIDNETKRFVENTKVDPEALIDFLDFYLSSKSEDKKLLLESVLTDFEGDGLANVVSSIALTEDDKNTVLYCLEILEKIKSPLLLKPLKYLSLNKDKEISKYASKIRRKLLMQGVSEADAREYHKELLKDFTRPEVLVSIPDGNSNFSVVISRKTKNNVYYLLFLAVSLELGPFSCFGFSKITKFDHDLTIRKFFNKSEQIRVRPSLVKGILDNLLLKRLSLNKIVPYEYYAWEKILDDLPSNKKDVEKILSEGLSKCSLSEVPSKIAFNYPFLDNWFFSPSKNNPSYLKFIEKIEKLSVDNLFKMEKIIDVTKYDTEIQNIIKKRLLYLAFCLKNNKCKDLADIYYSVLFEEKKLTELIKNILKKSVYEHFLNMKQINIQTKGLFGAGDTNAQLYIDYIEENWIE